MKIGVASKIINNKLGTYVQSATQALKAKEIRDDLEANALFIDGDRNRALFVNCDLAGIESQHVSRMRRSMAESSGMAERDIIIFCTHTHSGPSVVPTNYFMPVDEEYHERLTGWLAELAAQAVQNAVPGGIRRALGRAQLGYNRRVCFADGSHVMHGNAAIPEFAGMEGPDDPAHLALFAEDDNGKLLAVLYNNIAHPTNFFSRGIYSADFPGGVRAELRSLFGDVAVLFMNGAFGDIDMSDPLRKNRFKETGEMRMARAAHLALGETLRLYNDAESTADPVVRHAYEDLSINIRLADEKTLRESRALLREVDAGKKHKPFDILFAHGAVLLQKVYGENPLETVPVHAVRIGDVCIVTQPCELFCQFGLEIKRRSPTPYTAIASIADGYSGYCPTIAGILGGGYSGKPIYWTRLAEDAGYRIVESAGTLLNKIWRD